MEKDHKILVGMISGAHGVKGQMRLKSFTEEPEAIARYKPLTDEEGKQEFAFTFKSATSTHFVVEMKGVADRDAAEAMRGTKLFVARAALPKLKKREFYESDFIGLAVRDAKGKNCGEVAGVHDYGGGPFFEIKPPKGNSFMLPFTKDCVPEMEMEQGYIVIAVPEGWLEEGKKK